MMVLQFCKVLAEVLINACATRITPTRTCVCVCSRLLPKNFHSVLHKEVQNTIWNWATCYSVSNKHSLKQFPYALTADCCCNSAGFRAPTYVFCEDRKQHALGNWIRSWTSYSTHEIFWFTVFLYSEGKKWDTNVKVSENQHTKTGCLVWAYICSKYLINGKVSCGAGCEEFCENHGARQWSPEQ